MQVKISVRHGHLGEATQQIIRDKAEKLLHLFDRLTMIEVTVDMKKTEVEKCNVEFLVHLTRSDAPVVAGTAASAHEPWVASALAEAAASGPAH